MIKVNGNYYKSEKGRKVVERFELELEIPKTNNMTLTDLRKEAAEVLKKKDQDFRGIRELFSLTPLSVPKEEVKAETVVNAIISTEEELKIRQKAKELKINNFWNRKIDSLLEEIKKVEG